MENNIVPDTTIHAPSLTITLVEMRQGCVSVGILNEEGNEALFPYDWDDSDPDTAVRIARDLATGLKRVEDAVNMPHYTMPYPIQK